MNTPASLDCETVIRLLFTYLDGELEETSSRDVAEHLHQCRSCFSRAEFERRIRTHLAELGQEPVSAVFEERVPSLIGQFGCG